jgi:YggT family protein
VDIIRQLLWLYLIIIIVRIVLSWFPLSSGSPLTTVYELVYRITEPVLGPVRRILPPIGMGGMGLDLSPIVVIIVINLLIASLR